MENEGSFSEPDTIWRARVPVTLVDVGWLVTDTGEPGIIKRYILLVWSIYRKTNVCGEKL